MITTKVPPNTTKALPLPNFPIDFGRFGAVDFDHPPSTKRFRWNGQSPRQHQQNRIFGRGGVWSAGRVLVRPGTRRERGFFIGGESLGNKSGNWRPEMTGGKKFGGAAHGK